MRPTKVVPYDAAWISRFEEAAVDLRAAFGANLVAIHHIGSTAIPGMAAKPVIDILPVLHDVDRVADAESSLSRLGYEIRGENGIPGRRYFVKESDGERVQHVHAFEAGHPAITAHLAFRDYLAAHDAAAREYAALKLHLAARHAQDRGRYVEGKAALMAELERRALAWRARDGGTGAAATPERDR